MSHEDYNETLSKKHEELRKQTREGTLSLAERIEAIDEAVSDYVAAQDEDFEYKHAKGGHVPIQLRNDRLLDFMADLIMYEYLTWSHPDKMSIVEYPILSNSQQNERNLRDLLLEDVFTGKDDATIGRKRTADGDMVRIYDYMTPKHDNGLVPAEHIELYTALDNAGLTDRQRQAVNLVYFEDMTQEQAAEVMGVTRQAVDLYARNAINKIRRLSNE